MIFFLVKEEEEEEEEEENVGKMAWDEGLLVGLGSKHLVFSFTCMITIWSTRFSTDISFTEKWPTFPKGYA